MRYGQAMGTGYAARTFWAIAVAAGAAATVAIVGGTAQSALLALVGGIAAALAASGPAEPSATIAEPSSADSRSSVAEVFDAIAEPLLLVEHGRVSIANAAARGLLGAHVVGEDARVAIRHPAAAERLSTDPGIAGERPAMLYGIGAHDQRWEMRVADAGAGQRVVQLVDRSADDAAERMRVDFVANASHELRTPLASILGFVETLFDEAGADPALRNRFLRIMFDEARRMLRLVEDLISLSRIESERYRLPETPVDLAALLNEVCDELVGSGRARARDVTWSAVRETIEVTGDRAQLSQMLHNLIGNAMKYGRAGTPVSVRLDEVDPASVRLSVDDEGDGIPSRHIPRLTERFYRVDAGRSRVLGGTGLGLAIVKHIVERHRGRLDISSRVGIGTSVVVLLPQAGSLSRNRNTNATEGSA